MDVKKKILIIDDEADLTQMIGFQFSSKGFEVQTAGDGVEALQKVHQFHPDLIILDVNMPRMGGIEFYSKICGPDNKPLYPVLVLTARANIQGLFNDLDIDGFMIKPFEIDHLVYEAELIIKKRSQAASKATASLFQKARKVCLVDNDPKVFNALTGLLLEADYSVIPAKDGMRAIEKMMNDVPDVALVSLGLADIPGDILIFRLSQMAKTMEVKFVLYTPKNSKHAPEVLERISAKTGIMTFIEYNDLKDLLTALENL